jgi:hypothetical protein
MNKYKILVAVCAMLVTVQVTLAQPVAQNFNISQSMRFEENKGQVANTEGEVQHDILFTLKDKGMNVYFRKDGISYQWHYTEELMDGPYKISEATGLPINENEDDNLPEKFKEPKPTRLHTYRVDMKWQGSNENVQIVSEQSFEDYNNYYLAHCPDGITHVNGYSKLTYKNLYPGIDVQYYFKDGHLKYDVLVAAGADLSPLQFTYTGATPQLQNGKVKLSTPLGWLEEQQPVAWDERGKAIDIKYDINNNRIGFEKQTLTEAFTIDPGIIWATYYGGTGNDWIEEIRLGLNDDVFVSGTTASSSNIESGGHQSAMDVSTDAFLVKLNANGQRQWATYYGGNGQDQGYSVAVDNTNSTILAGYTTSTTAIPYLGHQLTSGGSGDAFIAKFDTQGVRQWASYYGGASGDRAYSTVCDSQNNIYIAGNAGSISGIAFGGYQNSSGGSSDAFIAKFNSSGVRQWGTYFGGGGSDNARSIALDASNSIFITGETQSTSAIATSGAHQITYAGGSGNDAFLAKFTTSGALLWATYMGGTLTDNGHAVSIDNIGNAYVAGLTYSTSGIAFNGFQSGISGQSEAFLVKFNASGTRLWGTYYGGTANDQADAIAIDDLDNVYLVGDTRSTTGVASGGYQNTIGSTTNADAFLAKFKSSGERIWGSYFGGTAFEGSGLGNERTSVCLDSDNNIYVAGLTTSSNGIAFLGHQNTLGGGYDGYIAKFQYLVDEPIAQPTNLTFSNIQSTTFSVSFSAASGSPTGYIAVRKTGSFSTTDPVEFGNYSVGETLGDGIIVHVGSATSFNQTALSASTTYFYKIYAYYSEGTSINYRQASPLSSSQATLPNPPTISSFSPLLATIGSSVVLTGTNFSTVSTDNLVQFNGTTATVTSSTATTINTTVPLNATSGKISVTRLGQTGLSLTDFIVLSDEPPAQATSLNFSSITPSSFTINFSAASDLPTGYIAVRRVGAAPTTDPVDGTVYTVGAALGNGTIAFVGSAATFNETSLTASTTYHYKIYSYNGSGAAINYRQTTPLAGSQTTSAALASEPTAQPTSILFSSVTSTSMTVSYTAPTGAPAGYIAVRRTGAAPTTDPVDGTAYTVGGTLGDGTIAFVGNALTFNETSLTASTTYHYKIYSYNGSGGTINYRQTIPLAGSQTTSAALASEPTSQPTSILFSSVTSTSMAVSYTAATGTPAGYIAVRRTGAAPTTDPVDGTAYTVGGTLGDGTIAYVGSAVTFNETGLTANTAYHYKIYSYNGSGAAINYLQTSPLAGNQTTSAGATAEPTAQPTNLLFSTVTAISMTVSYTAATGTLTGYIAVRKLGSAPTTDPVDGTAYTVGGTIGDGTIAYVGSAVTFNETGLTESTAYHYKIYSYNGSGGTINYRQTTPLAGSQTTSAALASEPTSQPTSILFSSVTSTSMTVSYTAATGAPAGYIAVRRTGAAPTTDPVDGTAYTVGGTLGDGTIAYVGSAVTFNETGLTASTAYHYKIYGYNGSGAAINYRQTSPLSGSQTTSAGATAEPTAQPISLVFSSITSTSMAVSYTAATGSPAGYIAVRRTGAAPTSDPVDGTSYTVGGTLGDGTIAFVGSALTFNETSLTASTAYHYKIYSYNGSGATINYRQTSPLTGSQTTSALGADTTPPQPGSNTTPVKVAAGSAVNVGIAISDTESGVTGARISYGPASSGTFSVTNQGMTNTSGTWSFTIPASAQSELGIRYQIVATNGANLTTTIGPLIIGIDYPNGVSIPYTAFGSALSNYRIITMPINLTNNSVNSVLGDNLGNYGDQSKWRMFRYNSGQTQELSGSSSLEPGRGYWLIATDNTTIDSGPGISNGGFDSPVTIPVTQGWNQIGNPYGFNLAWSDITTANSGLGLGNLRVYRTGSGFSDATTLNTTEGGFVFVNTAGTLAFSAVKNASVNGRQAARQAPLRLNSLDGEDWEVRFTLESGTIINELSGVGMHPNAHIGFDAFDDFTLPRFGNYLELNHTKELHGSAYSRDIVGPADAFSWQFEVDIVEPGPVTLQWSNLHLQGSTKKLVLWDMDARLPVNMEQVTKYKFNAPRNFTLHYGNSEYLSDKLSDLQLALYAPYPNPASGDVELQVWIPDADIYALQVIDPLGRVVHSLFNEKVEAGYHQFLWQRTESVVPGLYLVKLSNSKYSVYQKLVIH